jgi:leader peptidase (prepilin peptidase)/N-methyltransferase
VAPTEILPEGPIRLAVMALFGALVGSFLNVVIHRLPRGESVVSPGSRCPKCGHAIRPWENIPVLSWLLLGGRCAKCRASISVRYPLVEAVSAALVALCVARWGLTATAAIHAAFCLSMLVIMLIDYDHQIIPDAITLPGTALGLALVAWTEPTWLEALIGAAVGAGFLYAIGEAWYRMRKIEAMGGGDVKMAAYFGAILGWQGMLLTIFLGSFLGAIAGAFLMARGKGGMQTMLPFGTALAPSAVLVLFWGRPLIDWYLGLLLR